MSGRDRLGSVFGPPADQANPKCERCTKSVYPQEKIVYDTVAYHKSCFKCLSCTSTISNVSSVAKMDGNIYCKVCFKKAFRLKGSYNTISSPKQGQGGDEEAVASPVAEAVVSPKPAAASTPAAPVTSFSSSSPSPDEWLRSAQRDMNSRASVVVAPSEGAAAATKAAEDKAAADKKAAEDKAAADKKAAEDKAAADKKAAEDKAAAAKAAEEAAAEEEFVVVEKDTPADVTTVAEEAVAVVEEVKVEEPVVEEVKVEEPVVEEAAPVVEEVKVEEAAPVVEEVKIEEPVAAAEAPTVAAIPEDELAPIVEDAPVIIDDKKDIVAPLLTSSPSVDSTTSVTSPTPNARRERVASVFAAPTDLNNAKCGRCGKTAYAQERIVYDTVAYHKSCFKCQSCTSTISNVSAVAKMEGNVYCKVCFKKAFRTKGSYNTITTQGAQSPTDEAAQ